VADAAGVAQSAVDDAVVLPFNNLEATARLLRAHRDSLACVILEPVLGAGGVIAPADGFLSGLRELTRELGIILIFDEVISLRLAPGGAQEYYGVTPDLTALGKIIGGGLPVGAYGGRADLMAQLEPSGTGDTFDPRSGGPKIYQGGTFTGNPLTMAAGMATLDQLTPSEYQRLNALGDRLRLGLTRVFDELRAPAQVSGVGSLFNVHFTREPLQDARAPRSADSELAHLYFLEMLNRGIMLAPRGMGSLSTPMTEREIDRFIDETRGALLPLTAAA
jgi:glutamate-1-semialdehyde 2,1-aminomutase